MRSLWKVAGSTIRKTLLVLAVAVGPLLIAGGNASSAATTPPYHWTATAGQSVGLLGQIGTSDLTCPAAGWCVGVGVDLGSTGGNIQILSNGVWSYQNAPTDVLSSVSCAVVGSCVAVGPPQNLGGSVIETLSGGNWSSANPPVSGLNPPANDADAISINSVSCPTSTFCTAVGTYQSNPYGVEGLIETLSNGTWQATTAPLTGLTPAAEPPTNGATEAPVNLYGVSCPTAGTCFAVGQYYDADGNAFGLIETLDGGTWSASTVPASGLNPTAGPNPAVQLGQIQCTSATSCIAVGSYQDGASSTSGLIETLSGGQWVSLTAPLGGVDPSAAPNPKVALPSLDCVSSNSCVAVGSYTDAENNTDGLIETLSGGAWNPSTAPLSTLTDHAPTGSGPLDGVSCDSVGSCVAVGGDLIETLYGGAWSPSAAPGVTESGDITLEAVSCPAAGSCISLGAQPGAGRGATGLIETQSSGAAPVAEGYWEVASDGGLFSFNAPFYGSMGGNPLNAPVVGMAEDPCTGGYWDVASDGGIFSFNAPFYGSMGGKALNAPIVGIAGYDAGTTCGYWEVASDGGIFSFNAPYYGSMGGKPLVKPVVAIAADRLTGGYWEVASDGGIFSFNAPFYGSMGGKALARDRWSVWHRIRYRVVTGKWRPTGVSSRSTPLITVRWAGKHWRNQSWAWRRTS